MADWFFWSAVFLKILIMLTNFFFFFKKRKNISHLSRNSFSNSFNFPRELSSVSSNYFKHKFWIIFVQHFNTNITPPLNSLSLLQSHFAAYTVSLNCFYLRVFVPFKASIGGHTVCPLEGARVHIMGTHRHKRHLHHRHVWTELLRNLLLFRSWRRS